MIKILFVIDSLRPGGKERQLAQLLRGLRSRDDIAMELIVTRGDIGYPEVLDLDVPIHVVERKTKWNPGVFKRFYAIARAFKPDVIHTWDPIATIMALPAAKLLGIRLVNESIRHALPIRRFGKLWWLAKILLPLSDVVVANSLAGLRTYGFIPSFRALCVYNGFDPARARCGESASDARSRLGVRTPLLVGMVANFVEAKDYRTFLQAATAITGNRDDVSFVCVGDGPLLPKMKEAIPPQLAERIVFAGRQHPVEAVIAAFDIGVLACNTNGHAEGLSNAIMEMMGMGKPVIATDSGGNGEIVIHGQTGYLIPPFDATMLERKLRILLDDPLLRESLGAAGKRRIHDVFTMENLVDGHLEIYRRATA